MLKPFERDARAVDRVLRECEVAVLGDSGQNKSKPRVVTVADWKRLDLHLAQLSARPRSSQSGAVPARRSPQFVINGSDRQHGVDIVYLALARSRSR